MTIELKVPAVGESIQEVQIGRWLKKPGESVGADESVVELETDKASMEVPSPAAGILTEIVKQEGESVAVGDVIAYVDAGGGEKLAQKKSSEKKSSDGASGDAKKAAQPKSSDAAPRRDKDGAPKQEHPKRPEKIPAQEVKDRSDELEPKRADTSNQRDQQPPVPVTPAARRALREYGLTAAEVETQGKRLRAADVEQHVEKQRREEQSEITPDKGAATTGQLAKEPAAELAGDLEQVVPMSLIRRRIAKRLVEAQHNAALLTTFNEIDMSAVMQLREKYRQQFQDKYGIKLGFMSFFVKAVVDALKQFPGLNGEIREGDKIVYRNYYHIGVAIGSAHGLVVPVLRFAERMSFAEIEQAIADFAQRARDKRLKPEELEGGTFTISNGGVYGSLLSTPIVNPPQSGVLGMHAIQDRPVAREGQVVIRPMMYVALTYDHRIVDGSESVSCLKRIKEAIEEPSRMLIEV